MPTDPDLLLLGQSIRRLRQERDLTQEELGHRAGLSANYVGDLERGTRNVGAKALFALARGLNVGPSALFKGINSATLDMDKYG